jgi:hypothetical protein
MYIWLLVMFCGLLAGCVKKESEQKSAPQKNSYQSTLYKKTVFDQSDIERQEAALLDIAIPPYQERLPLFCEDQYTGQVVLGYYSDCKPEDQRKFFHEQMERYGWNLRREFKGPELLLEFEKPTRSCAVSIRPHLSNKFFSRQSGTDIVIYVEDSSVVY